MTDYPGIGGGGVGTMVDTHIGTTDSGGGHPDQHVVYIINSRFVRINDFQLVGFYNLYSFHGK